MEWKCIAGVGVGTPHRQTDGAIEFSRPRLPYDEDGEDESEGSNGEGDRNDGSNEDSKPMNGSNEDQRASGASSDED